MNEHIDDHDIEVVLLANDLVRFHISDGNGKIVVFKASRLEAKRLAIGILAEDAELYVSDADENED